MYSNLLSFNARPPLFLPKTKKPKTEATLSTRLPSPTSDVDDFDYNSDDDPEWRNTPMAKRIKKLKEEDAPPKMLDMDGQLHGRVGKRLSRSHCNCRTGGCKNCTCSKVNRACSQECGCSASGICKNTANENVLVTVFRTFFLRFIFQNLLIFIIILLATRRPKPDA